MLLRLEAENERSALALGINELPKRKYDRLKARTVDKGTKRERVIDQIVSVPFDAESSWSGGSTVWYAQAI